MRSIEEEKWISIKESRHKEVLILIAVFFSINGVACGFGLSYMITILT